jgi:hypothetical protein
VGSSPGQFKPKTMKLVFVVSPLRTQHLGERAKTGYLGIMIMWATCLSADCCKRVGLVQSTLHRHLIEN